MAYKPLYLSLNLHAGENPPFNVQCQITSKFKQFAYKNLDFLSKICEIWFGHVFINIYIYIFLILLHGVQEQIKQRADVVGENFGRFIFRMR